MVERYKGIFVNRKDVYARQSNDGQAYFCVRQPVTDQVLEAHLEGWMTCGFYCLNQESKVKWAVVDIDHDQGIQTAQTIYERLRELNVPAYIEESREFRAHLWVFTLPWPAKPLRILMHALVDEEHIEIFPKQDRLGQGGVGSCVRGPLGIHRKTGQRYPFLDPETLERIEDSPAYLRQIERANGSQLAEALNEVLRERPRIPREGVIYQYNRSEGDTLAVARALHIPLEEKSGYFQGICPFHPNENHPSFTIYPNNNLWICWHGPKVGRGGISLYAALHSISYADAREVLTETRR